MPIVSIPIDQLRPEIAGAMRAKTDLQRVAEYAKLPADAFPPVVVFEDDRTGERWMGEGILRMEAAEARGEAELTVDLRPGTRRDAYVFAARSNARHGLPRTWADKRGAVRKLLLDPEYAGQSDEWFAQTCAVSRTFVACMRKRLGMPEDAARRGIDGKTRRLPPTSDPVAGTLRVPSAELPGRSELGGTGNLFASVGSARPLGPTPSTGNELPVAPLVEEHVNECSPSPRPSPQRGEGGEGERQAGGTPAPQSTPELSPRDQALAMVIQAKAEIHAAIRETEIAERLLRDGSTRKLMNSLKAAKQALNAWHSDLDRRPAIPPLPDPDDKSEEAEIQRELYRIARMSGDEILDLARKMLSHDMAMLADAPGKSSPASTSDTSILAQLVDPTCFNPKRYIPAMGGFDLASIPSMTCR